MAFSPLGSFYLVIFFGRDKHYPQRCSNANSNDRIYSVVRKSEESCVNFLLKAILSLNFQMIKVRRGKYMFI